MTKQAEYFTLDFYSNNKNNRIEITRAEAERAIYAMATAKVFLSKQGAIAGNNISSVLPDFNRAMGYLTDYRLQGEDWEYIRRDIPEYLTAMEDINTRVKYLTENNKEHLIGTLVTIPELEKGRVPEDIKKLTGDVANKFKI